MIAVVLAEDAMIAVVLVASASPRLRGHRDDDQRDVRRDVRDDRGRDESDYDDRYRSERDDLESESSRYGEPLPLPAAEERPSPFDASPFDAPPREFEDSSIEAREESLEFDEEPADDDFAGSDMSDSQETARDTGLAEGALPTRRRRRRRGRRGVLREDAFLGIDRLATEDLVGHEPPVAEQRREDRTEDRDDISLGEEITSIEIGGDEDNGDPAAAGESDLQRRRRRRRRRGRGSKERSSDRTRGDDSAADEDDDAEMPRHDRAPLAEIGDENRRDAADEDDEFDAQEEDTERPSKNLHREVTPWAEAIGFIVSANMEARGEAQAAGERAKGAIEGSGFPPPAAAGELRASSGQGSASERRA